jgi:outer membrane protein OmpU
MNKLMLSAAAVALTLGVSPAIAADNGGVKLNVGGYFKGYVNYTNEDDVHSLDLIRDTEVHFGGETTLDNGLTVGAHIEADADGADGFEIDESYIYFAGSWGRVNLGEEDGAAYLLQVAAPSADDNIDGIRQTINPYATSGYGMDYANDTFKDSDKVTYLSPVFSGFQAGVSYTPDNGAAGSAGNGADNTNGVQSDAWELAVRYEGMVGNVGVIAGAGYTTANEEGNGAGVDDFQEWNVGVDLDIGAFGVGALYTENNNSSSAEDENETWVVGVDYTTGPFKIGASYLNNDEDLATDTDTDRFAAGVIYTYGPGMTFRGSIGYQEQDNAGAADTDATVVSVGTQINF